MRTYYEKVLNGMQRPILLVAVTIVALLSASGRAMGVTSTEGTNEGHAVKSAASDRLTASAAIPTSTAFKTVTLTIPQGSGTKNISGSVRFDSPVKSAAVVLNGFKLDYLSTDQHTDVIEVDVDLAGRTPPPPLAQSFSSPTLHTRTRTAITVTAGMSLSP
jgi:hypothetical protein